MNYYESAAKKLAPSPFAHQKKLLNVITDDTTRTDVALPPILVPGTPISGSGVAQFYQLKDKSTGVLALGSFSATDYVGFHQTLLDGLVGLKSAGVTKLIVDVVRPSCKSAPHHVPNG